MRFLVDECLPVRLATALTDDLTCGAVVVIGEDRIRIRRLPV